MLFLDATLLNCCRSGNEKIYIVIVADPEMRILGNVNRGGSKTLCRGDVNPLAGGVSPICGGREGAKRR